MDWMNKVLSRYSDRKAVICLHRYLNVKTSEGSYLDYAGIAVQREVVARNPNVIAVLNGHYHGSSFETVKFDDDNDGVNERTVYQICTDYQSGFEGGNEYIKMLYFDLDNDKIYINSYSPVLDDFNYYDEPVVNLDRDGIKGDSIDAFVLDVDFDTEEKTIDGKAFTASVRTADEIGTVNVGADKTASIVWNGLESGTDYTWYAVAANSLSGKLTTGMNEFTTKVRKEETTPSDEDGKPLETASSDEDGKSLETTPSESVMPSETMPPESSTPVETTATDKGNTKDGEKNPEVENDTETSGTPESADGVATGRKATAGSLIAMMISGILAVILTIPDRKKHGKADED